MSIHVIYAAIIVAILGGGATWLHYRDMRYEEAGVQKQLAADKKVNDLQVKLDEAKKAKAGEVNAKDLADIASYNFNAGKSSVVCYSTRPASQVPAATVLNSGSPPASVVAPSDGLHPDISGALKVFATLAARLQADANRLNAETH